MIKEFAAGADAKRIFSHALYVSHNPAALADFLDDFLVSGSRKNLMTALLAVAKARGGVSALAKRTAIDRSGLYRKLLRIGNPKLTDLENILAAFDLRLAIVPKSRNRCEKPR